MAMAGQGFPERGWRAFQLEPGACGFTLMEMLVVLFIVSLLLVTIPPFLAAGMATASAKGAARQLASDLRFARSMAIAGQQEAVLALDLDNRSYRVPIANRSVSLSNSLSLVLVTAESERIGEGQGMIRFFPDGSATGGRITVGHGNGQYDVDVDWLSGKVTLLE
jgi:general secretion pathway protein H